MAWVGVTRRVLTRGKSAQDFFVINVSGENRSGGGGRNGAALSSCVKIDSPPNLVLLAKLHTGICDFSFFLAYCDFGWDLCRISHRRRLLVTYCGSSY